MKKLIFVIISFALIINTNLVMADLDNGLVAFYPFNGNANDESGNDNNGVAEGVTLSVDRFNNINSAYNFDGQNDYIKVPNGTLLNFNKGSFTISVWIKVDDTIKETDIYHIIDKRKGDGAGTGYDLYLNSYSANIALQGCDPNLDMSSSKNLNDSLWHNIVIVYDKANSSSIIFIDNKNDVQNKTIDCDITNEGNLYIGCRFNTAGYFKGVIDDIRIYNRPLSDLEVQELFNIGLPQEGNIFGHIATSFAGHENLSVVNANVSLVGTNYSSNTNSHGNFIITDIEFGNYILDISAPNLKRITQQVTIDNNEIQINPVKMELNFCDFNNDDKIGIEEAINILQIISNQK